MSLSSRKVAQLTLAGGTFVMNWRFLLGVSLLGLLLTACGAQPSTPALHLQPPVLSVEITPTQVTLPVGGHAAFTVAPGNTPDDIVWTVEEPGGGTIDASGRYTAPAAPGTFTVVAASASQPDLRDEARVIVEPAEVPVEIRVAVEPTSGRVSTGESMPFSAVVTGTEDPRVTWNVLDTEGGSIDDDGVYAAPHEVGTYRIRATSVADREVFADAEVEVVEGVAVSISPDAATIAVDETLRLAVTVTGTTERDVTWSVEEDNGGMVDAAGLYTPPSMAGEYHVVATSMADPRRSDRVTVTVTDPIAVEVSPDEGALEFSESQVFAAAVTGTGDQRVTWSVVEAGGGSIDTSGRYTAPNTAGVFHVVATSVADPRRSDTVAVTVRPPVAVEVAPESGALEFGETMTFAATVTGTTNTQVTWSVQEAGGGTISTSGHYTAPITAGVFHVVATSVADPRRSDTVAVTVRPPVAVAISPGSGALEFGEAVTFAATVTGTTNTQVTWSVQEAGGGTISTSGHYIAPNTAGVFHVVATSVADPRRSDTVAVTVRPPVAVAITPGSGALEFGEATTFAATVTGTTNSQVTWSVHEAGGGTITTNGRYTAPNSAGVFHVVATSVADPRRSDTVAVTVRPPVAVAVTPGNGALEFGEAITFSAAVTGTTNTQVTWSVQEAGGGTINTSGRYTAPNSAGVFHVVATSVADPRRTDTVAVTVSAPVVVDITPASGAAVFGQALTFSAALTGTTNQQVTWSVQESGGGTINSSGLYTAPNSAGVFHVIATSVADPRRSDTATVTVSPPVAVTVSPNPAQVEVGESHTFTAQVTGTTNNAVTWSVDEPGGGTVSSSGTYAAPQTGGTFHVRATSVADPTKFARATVVVVIPSAIDMDILPPDRRTTWSPGIPGGIPTARQVHTTLNNLIANGTGDNSAAIQQAIQNAGAAYQQTGTIQEVVLPAGTFRFTSTISLNRSGVVLRGQGPALTRLRYDGTGRALRIARASYGTYTAADGPWSLVADAFKGTNTIVLSNANAAAIEEGDILAIDEEDDPTFVRMGDARYEKRQPAADTHGPALRGAGLWRSVTSLIQVVGKTVGATQTTLELADPLHMNFRTARYAQVFHVATEYSSSRSSFEGVHYAGVEDLYITGGSVTTNNVAFCWFDGLEIDGNPGTPNIGTYTNPAGITGRSLDLFHAYRCEVRGNYIHHSRSIAQGGGAYLLSLSSKTSESLIEDNIVVFGNKLIVGNMMGGGNVIAYNYVDNARTSHASWQEGAIDLNHQSFTHNALVEGNWATNLTSDTTHGNAGWHVFFRNYGTGQNSAPIYGAYPYTSAPDGSYRRAAGTDGWHREVTYVGNVLRAGTGTGVYQVDHTTGAQMSAAAVWRIGWGVDGDGGTSDNGTALNLLYRHGNYDTVTAAVSWDPQNAIQTIPSSLYLTAKPAFFGAATWPWVEPTATTAALRIQTLPAKARYDALTAP